MKHFFQRLKSFYTLNYTGLLIGLLGFVAALTPSLMPRPALFMGIVAGFGFMIGYSVGVLLSHTVRWLGFGELSPHVKHHAWRAAATVLPLVAILTGFAAADWQNEVRQLVGVEPIDGAGITVVAVVSLLVASLLLLLSRGVRGLFRRIQRRVSRIEVLPRRVAIILSLVLVSILLVFIANGVLARSFLAAANSFYQTRNTATDPGVVQPTSPLRSGSSDSLVSWDTLGRNGRSFVGTGPSAHDISRFTGREATEPIRAYISAEQADSAQARAELAVRELERTGAFERDIIVITTTTGSGWVEPGAAAAIEYLHDGNTAHVALQYSYLPSWLALLVTRPAATEAGRALFEAVYAKAQTLPADEQPRIVSFGLSLGAYGGQAAFSSASDMVARLDGALYLGTPGFAEPWQTFTANREVGSRQILPVYGGGTTVQFAGTREGIAAADTDSWQSPRVLYLQYASDPIVWWQPSLIWSQPDWLREAPGDDVSPRLRWFPVVTFLQLTVDQFFANDKLGGHGHNYAPDVVHAWAAVTQPDNWKSEQLDKLQTHIDVLLAEPN